MLYLYKYIYIYIYRTRAISFYQTQPISIDPHTQELDLHDQKPELP